MSGGPRFLDEAPSPAPAAEAPRAPVLFEAQAGSPAVVEQGWLPAEVTREARGSGLATLVAGGVALILGGWGVTAGAMFLADAWARSAWLGGIASAAFAAGAGLIGLAGWREARALRRLRRVDLLRSLLADDAAPVAALRAAAEDWVAQLAPGPGNPDALHRALAQAGSAAELRAVLADRVARDLAAATERAGNAAALRGAGLVAVAPHPALDALVVGLVGLRLVREVAALHGMRPGGAALLALLRRIGWAIAGTAGTDLLAQGLSEEALANLPVLRHLAASVPGASVAALRLRRLARAAAAACSPLGPG